MRTISYGKGTKHVLWTWPRPNSPDHRPRYPIRWGALMLALLCYIIAAVIFFLVGRGNVGAVDTVWGLFFVALGLCFDHLPAFVTGVRNRQVDVL